MLENYKVNITWDERINLGPLKVVEMCRTRTRQDKSIEVAVLSSLKLQKTLTSQQCGSSEKEDYVCALIYHKSPWLSPLFICI